MSRRRRVVFAVLFSLAVPGAGHAYLRSWARAVLWALIATTVVTLLVPTSFFAATEMTSLAAVVERSLDLPLRVHAGAAVVRGLSAGDAGQLAAQKPATESGAGQCPHCGGELDPEIDFCPWCTARLELDVE